MTIRKPVKRLARNSRGSCADSRSDEKASARGADVLPRTIEPCRGDKIPLNESQHIIAAILNAVPARIFWKDRNLVYLGCNTPFANDAGFASPDEIVGKDDYQMAWREQADLYRNDDREVIETGRSKLLIDEPQTTPDGRVITLLTSKVPLRNSNGEIFGILGTYLDVSERAQLEENLEVRTSQLDAALNNMAQGLLMFDPTGKLVVSNRRFAEQFKLPLDKWNSECSGLTILEIMRLVQKWTAITEQNHEQIVSNIREVVDSKNGGRFVFERTDGSTFCCSTAMTGSGGYVVTFEDITEQRRSEEKIAYMAHHDALTDLPNRVLFYGELREAFSRMPKSGGFAILSLDLDHFKNVNDMLGHPVGDKLLKAAAKRIRFCIRENDIACRIGGDEFAVLQTALNGPADSAGLATRLITTISAPYQIDGHQVVIGVSIGIAIAPGDGTEPDQIMKNSDLALYRAKVEGRGVYRLFEIEMDARMQERRTLELDLRKALANGEFILDYQPIVTLKEGIVSACEALIRWQHPQRGLIPPLSFIPIAEETGLIASIGKWVLEKACSDAATWPDHVGVSVNVSPAQLKRGDFVATVKNALKESGLDPSRLELEITELTLLDDSELALSMLHQLKALGVGVAMDDFGTGYSSLGYLRSFPFDRIKIDQSFIRDLSASKDSLAILRAVIGLGSSLSIVTTAEGVETADQLEILKTEGCTDVQGFFFTPPRPAAEIQTLLAAMHGKTPAVAKIA